MISVCYKLFFLGLARIFQIIFLKECGHLCRLLKVTLLIKINFEILIKEKLYPHLVYGKLHFEVLILATP